MKKILVAVDGSDASMHAARMGKELATALKATLTLAHSVPPMMLPGEVPFTVVNDVVKAELSNGREVLNKTLAHLGGQEGMQIEIVELEGPPAERLSELAESGGYDLLVVGSHGKGAVARLILGSVADRMVHICKRPVLVVR